MKIFGQNEASVDENVELPCVDVDENAEELQAKCNDEIAKAKARLAAMSRDTDRKNR